MPDLLLHFRHSFLFQGDPPRFPLNRAIHVPTDGEPVALMVVEGPKIVATWRCEVAAPLVAELQAEQFAYKDMPDPAQRELFRIGGTMANACRQFSEAIKYYLDRRSLREEVASAGRGQWSLDGETWKGLPGGGYIVPGNAYSEFPIDEAVCQCLQNVINRSEKLLPFSLRHLHRARNEGDPRHQWIDATIAAELAIKEFLIRFHPDIRTLLLDVPSPPLPKMYGSILKSFVNEESPVKKELAKGAEIRNTLVHRPQDHEITPDQAFRYVETVEYAINHLLTFLLPNDPVIRDQFFKSKSLYEEAKIRQELPNHPSRPRSKKP